MNTAPAIVIEAEHTNSSYWRDLFRSASYFIFLRGVMSSFATSKP
jgi:hypothetical protein